MSASWTIQQLGEAVEARLAGEEAPANGQVRAVPDQRSIRYYTTLGLLDRPTMRGRSALYGRRHLAQLVAIKRLQAEGRTLAEIQRVLPTFDDAELAQRSGVELSATRHGAARRDFWRVPAAAAATNELETSDEALSSETAPPSAASFVPVLELILSPGVRLTIQTARPATDADAAALLDAAAPLLAELARRHLVPHPSETDPVPPETEGA